LGEGVAEAELVAWHVTVGDAVTPDSVLAEILTDKAAVEILSPFGGVVVALHGDPGDVIAVGGDFVTLQVAESQTSPTADDARPAPRTLPGSGTHDPIPRLEASARADNVLASRSRASARSAASPAVRTRARALGVDLASVAGSGANGRVEHSDLDRILQTGATRRQSEPTDEVIIEPVRGVRRKIAERVTEAWTQCPHITLVDAIDATELEAMRTELNERGIGPKVTPLPFICRAIVLAVSDQPRLNAHYDAAGEVLSIFEPVHIGIATQTDDGLLVPVVRHAENRGLNDLVVEIARLAAATRAKSATREELTGSSITVTSLGALGGLMNTPILNIPEVSIVGVNRLETRPAWRDGIWVPRQMFNLSCSFDHRIVDGWDAGTFLQRVKTLLELPSLLFSDEL
jgi:2-oxoisovalerate dehydrogenase E2 component (dihydrolipoyl transacylase)